MILTIFAILIYGIYSLVSNIVTKDTEQNCEKPGALAFLCGIKVEGSVDNKKDHPNLLIIQLWLGFVFSLVWSIGARLIRNLGRRKNQ